MKLIVGLGNPGKRFEGTRHNVGAEIVSAYADNQHIVINRTSLKSEWGRANIAGEPVIVARPVTYMNLSGEAVLALKQYFKIELNDILIVSDDFSLPLGKLRFRAKGSAGGHNGLKSIINSLGTNEFQRLKAGIDGPPSVMAVSDYVLGRFRAEDNDMLNDMMNHAVKAIACWVADGLDQAMRRFH